MTVEFKEIERVAEKMGYYFEQLPLQIERLEKEVHLCDLETSDILHMIELDNFNASDGFKHAKDLQITRQRRRQCKDELESLNQLFDKMKVNRPFHHQVAQINKLSKSRKQILQARGYSPRVRTDMVQKFIICNKKKRKSLKGE